MGVAEETREIAIAPVRESLLALIVERRPGDAAALCAFAAAYVRRMPSDEARGASAEALYGEIAGVFDFAAARGERPIAVRAFTPTRQEHGYETAGSVVETNTEDLAFLLDSVRGVLQAKAGRIQDRRRPLRPSRRVADARAVVVVAVAARVRRQVRRRRRPQIGRAHV